MLIARSLERIILHNVNLNNLDVNMTKFSRGPSNWYVNGSFLHFQSCFKIKILIESRAVTKAVTIKAHQTIISQKEVNSCKEWAKILPKVS